ncbi:DUF885 family protein [uncultured Microbulbifer sp.]|uniref:DUF885 domain-containing protein n=1 Tax=uncultured Microbulbifer sp. TaxID=348147 RepID=UPI00260D1626|nr:DUF885 domain-containing protein [uncultured Microbulbifer sp.]
MDLGFYNGFLKMTYLYKVSVGMLALSSALFGCSVANDMADTESSSAFDSSEKLHNLANQYSEVFLTNSQADSYFLNVQSDRHNLFLNNSPDGFSSLGDSEDEILKNLANIDPANLKSDQERAFYFKLKEQLEANVGVRVCNAELWSVNHMFGPHIRLSLLSEFQPVETAQNKSDAIERWRSASGYYEQEIINLKDGLKLGYSAPKSVVNRVIKQVDALTRIPIDEHPFFSLAQRAEDPKFAAAFKQVLVDDLIPSMKRYSEFLKTDYLPKARVELGIHAIPNGRECYMAQYRSYTGLQRTPEQVFQLGLNAVKKNKIEITRLGALFYQAESFSEAVERASEDKSQKFNSADEMHEFYEALVAKSKDLSADFFYGMPSMVMEVKAIPEYEQGSGRSAHYTPGNEERAARFAYDPTTYKSSSYASAETVTIHEGYPGHHMQIALSQEQDTFHQIENTFMNGAFVEGWGRYAEHLAEEADIYQYASTRILRRAWPARGMVADTGMHLLGWSNEEVADFLKESGASFAKDPSTLMDRMAVMPAQLTSYDSGALEIFALRELMQKELDEGFDIKDFHEIILKNGSLPLPMLNGKVWAFIQEKKKG